MAMDTEDMVIQRGMYRDWPDVREVGYRTRPQVCLEQRGTVTQEWAYHWSKLGI